MLAYKSYNKLLTNKQMYSRQMQNKQSHFREIAEKNPEKYGNCGASWTDKEEKQMLKSIDENKTIEQIAIEHKRTVGGIHARLKRIARDLYNDGKSVSQIHDKLKLLSVDTISEYIDIYGAVA